jgi:uncharacterized phiE125 gp8 family phage protein
MDHFLVRTAAPAALPIDTALVYAHLRAIPDDEGASPADPAPADAAYIDELIAAAVSRLDGPSGLLNRALITQSWEARYPGFCPEIVVPLARVQTVDSVKCLDASGVERTLDPSLYRVTGRLSDDCRIRPAIGKTWPATLRDREAVVVSFTSGFGDTSDDVPATIRHALLEMIATAYEHREAVISGSIFSSLPGAASAAVLDWKVYGPL